MSLVDAVRLRRTGGDSLRALRARSMSAEVRGAERVFRPIERSVPGRGRDSFGSLYARGAVPRRGADDPLRSISPSPFGMGLEVVERGLDPLGRGSEVFRLGVFVRGERVVLDRVLGRLVDGRRESGWAEGRELVRVGVLGRDTLGREEGRAEGLEAEGREEGLETEGREEGRLPTLGRLLGRLERVLGRLLGRLLGRDTDGRELLGRDTEPREPELRPELRTERPLERDCPAERDTELPLELDPRERLWAIRSSTMSMEPRNRQTTVRIVRIRMRGTPGGDCPDQRK